MDLPEIGWSVEVVTDGDAALGAATADELGRRAWSRPRRAARPQDCRSRRRSTTPPRPATGRSCSPTAPTRRAPAGMATAPSCWPALLAHPDADRGAADDHRRRRRSSAAWRPASAPRSSCRSAARSRPGSGRSSSAARSRCWRSGAMQLDPPWSPTDVGRIAVLRVGAIDVVLSERKAWHLDTVIYRHVGRDPARYQVVQAKSAGGFRARYEPFAAEIVEIETTGPCDSDLTRLPFRRITRPLWPFDPELDAPWPADEPAVSTGGAVMTGDAAARGHLAPGDARRPGRPARAAGRGPRVARRRPSRRRGAHDARRAAPTSCCASTATGSTRRSSTPAPTLRLVALASTGYDSIDVPAADRRGVAVTNSQRHAVRDDRRPDLRADHRGAAPDVRGRALPARRALGPGRPRPAAGPRRVRRDARDRRLRRDRPGRRAPGPRLRDDRHPPPTDAGRRRAVALGRARRAPPRRATSCRSTFPRRRPRGTSSASASCG